MDRDSGQSSEAMMKHFLKLPLGSVSLKPTPLTLCMVSDNERLALKLGHGKLAYESLLKEYDLYRNQLAPLQHDIVPICYGMFTNIHENNPDASYSCLVLDWYPENAPFTDSVDLDEDLTNEDPITQVQRSALKYAKVSKLRAVQKLHECGVLLGNLQDSTRFKINPHNGEVAVVGFGNAAARECTGSIWDTYYRAELDRFEKLYLDPMGQLPSMNELIKKTLSYSVSPFI
ncbi:hypothetical protein QCA50_002198 [Cerrena zonata]|uniref:Uncharacterized protein n=1 Tax=Cerrena zonata TaxID=2478898 RepID=A0AAW0GP82_9APHY